MGQQETVTVSHRPITWPMYCGPRASPLCVQHCIQLTSISFHVNRPSHSYNMAIENLTLKIQGQSHGWGQSLKSQLGSNILSNHIILVTCQSTLLFLWYSFFKLVPSKSRVKVIARGHIVGIRSCRLISLWFHVNRPSHSWDTAFSKFDLENPRSR